MACRPNIPRRHTMPYCDQCGPNVTAKAWLLTNNGPLALCQHHANQHATTGYEIIYPHT
ncbi:DUF7455 domain-containing protein, partial [Escherichia coli]|uniref:DUF7455 domain-containing protein n=1 Tax=Escherichia coli TaxID=562 RepID=UPI003F752613